jgi:2-amino-4-hydroxy-6-hydroxymethyldihydropteridine diphosphokinase
MARVFVSIGSNIDAPANVRAAVQALAGIVSLAAISTVYCSEAEGRPGQPPFYNCVVEIQTDLQPADLKYKVLRNIEAELGRQRTQDKYAPRTIDLDLILYENLILNTDGILIPDPEILHRAFLAMPLAELDPDLVIPGTGVPVSNIAASLRKDAMEPLLSYTESLRDLVRFARS